MFVLVVGNKYRYVILIFFLVIYIDISDRYLLKVGKKHDFWPIFFLTIFDIISYIDISKCSPTTNVVAARGLIIVKKICGGGARL